MKGQGGSDEATNSVFGVGAGGLALAGALRVAGSVAAFLSGAPQPGTGPAGGIAVILNPLNPGAALQSAGLNPFAYWAVLIVMLLALFAAAWGVWRTVRGLHQKSMGDPHRIDGVASPAEISHVASPKVLLKRATTLRPSLTDAKPSDVGYLIGRSNGRQVWATVEDSMLLVGPPRSGKGLHMVINMILDAPGAVITTSTRPDNLTATLRARERIGPVAVFDAQRLAPGLPSGLKWSPVRGCEDALTAMIRAAGLASSTGLGGKGVENGGFWEGKTKSAIQALLHAAALDQRDTQSLYQWALNPTAATDAVRILQTASDAAGGWGDSLDSMIGADPRTRDNIWQGVSLAFASLADPRVLDAVSPGPEESFDPKTFLEERGTMFLLATGAGAGASAPLVAALIEDLVETARKLAARSAGARLDPPVLLPLDEIGNLAPLPSLPTLMAEGGGTGITAVPVLQSLAQAREKWGENNANAIWDASIVKILLGGASNSRDLRDLSILIGERDERIDSMTIGDGGSRSSQRSIRRVSVMPPDLIRTLPFGTGVVLLRTARPIITDLRPWTERPDAKSLQADRQAIEALLRDHST